MVVKAEVDKRQLASARALVRQHPWNKPGGTALRASKKVSKDLARDVKALIPVRTGRLRGSVKPVAKRESGVIHCGIKILWYGVFVNKRVRWFERYFKSGDILNRIKKEIEDE